MTGFFIAWVNLNPVQDLENIHPEKNFYSQVKLYIVTVFYSLDRFESLIRLKKLCYLKKKKSYRRDKLYSVTAFYNLNKHEACSTSYKLAWQAIASKLYEFHNICSWPYWRFFFFFRKILIPFTNLFCSFFLVSLVLSSKEVVTNCYGNEKRRNKNHGLCY